MSWDLRPGGALTGGDATVTPLTSPGNGVAPGTARSSDVAEVVTRA